jgi:hypothetical protein
MLTGVIVMSIKYPLLPRDPFAIAPRWQNMVILRFSLVSFGYSLPTSLLAKHRN